MHSVVFASPLRRMFATAVDGLLILIPILVFSLAAFLDFGIAMLALLLSHFAYAYYCIYFHSRFGATLGKYLFGIQVLNEDFTRFSNKVAFKRSSIDLGFALVGFILAAQTLYQIDYVHFSTMAFFAREEYFASQLSSYSILCAQVFSFWVLSEFFVMLFNKKQQAIQDMMAGTVVVVKASIITPSVSELN